MAKHLGGFDCSDCKVNYARKETLHTHFQKAHQKKLDPDRDYGHFNRAERESLLADAKVKKLKLGTNTGTVVASTSKKATSSDVKLTGDQIMMKCLESSAMNTKSTMDLIQFLDTTAPNEPDNAPGENASSALGGDRVSSPLNGITDIDMDIPTIDPSVDNIQDYVNKQWEGAGLPKNSDNHPERGMSQDTSPHVPMDTLDTDSQEVEIIIIPENTMTSGLSEAAQAVDPASSRDDETPENQEDDPFDKYSVVTMDAVDQTVERIRKRNIRLYLHMLAMFSHLSTLAENLDLQGDLDADEIINEIRSQP
jgi:hypothetical protein